ncbi:MAG TPA: response regulator [Verrucomicrobiae bacterium]|nr:response regulator [Verrucomicrobiae bacterium]
MSANTETTKTMDQESKSMGKLLVVDDDEALRRLIRIQLSDVYEIVDSGEPDQGLALALESKPDAILLDLRMPKYSGYELLQTFSSFSRTHTIPVVIVSGEAGGQTKEYCQQLGAAGYFEKPIDFDALRACLQDLIKSRPAVPQTEVRVRLRISLKLRGTDANGKQFEEPASTDEVSLSGFLCACNADMGTSSLVDVYLARHGAQHVGKARIIHVSANGGPSRRYGCRFVEKTGPWVLQ